MEAKFLWGVKFIQSVVRQKTELRMGKALNGSWDEWFGSEEILDPASSSIWLEINPSRGESLQNRFQLSVCCLGGQV